MLLQVSVVVIRVAVVVSFSFSFFVTVTVPVRAETAVTVAVTGLVKGEGHAFFFLKRIHKSIFKKYQSKSAGTQQLPLCLEIINIHKKAHVITFFFKKLYKI